MSGSFYCLDNDIILKLATYNLFDYTFRTFGIYPTQIKILDSFKYKVGAEIKRKRGNKATNSFKYNIQKALQITENYPTISELDNLVIDINIYGQLLNYTKISNDKHNPIDKGEAILISHICYLNQQNDNNYLLTGDKRCLRALTNSSLTNVIEHLEGKIWCLEQLILKNIEVCGFDVIQAKIYPIRDCDRNIEFIFGYSVQYPEEIVKENLKSEIIRLKQETGKLLYPYPN
ncbi:hypothetical protein VB711_17765 [Cronbergia sp. UHCC 0137]|uniref:hypothetical protein n=1 Tax=Cronbergia sp. UHCC 0137 TaxID=3110239 RepID=UPI002B20D9AD|nr:hypothetical protein [Cronbergia sp. UHCC 0137]MEA5619672.1 hypothetical protein [Cronbergia sp. UHCC 0137]